MDTFFGRISLSFRKPRDPVDGERLKHKLINYNDDSFGTDNGDEGEGVISTRKLAISRFVKGPRRYVSRSGKIGHGKRDYRTALKFIRQWKHCSLGWTEIVRSEMRNEQKSKSSNTSKSTVPGTGNLCPEVYIGSRYQLSARTFGVWISNPLIINDIQHGKRVYSGKKTKKYMRLAHRTLQGHVLQGEETFELELKRDGSVWYRISSVSRPCHLLSCLGYPILFIQQTRFMSDSLNAVKRCIDTDTKKP